MENTKVIYCDYSNTIRLMPQNYWLASVTDKKLIFDSWDGQTKKLLKYNLVLMLKIVLVFLKVKFKK